MSHRISNEKADVLQAILDVMSHSFEQMREYFIYSNRPLSEEDLKKLEKIMCRYMHHFVIGKRIPANSICGRNFTGMIAAEALEAIHHAADVVAVVCSSANVLRPQLRLLMHWLRMICGSTAANALTEPRKGIGKSLRIGFLRFVNNPLQLAS